MVKRTLCLLLVLLALASTASAAEQGFAALRKDGVNFRKTPGGDRICFLDKDTAVFILGEEVDPAGVLWYRVRALHQQNSLTGFLRADMVAPPSELFQDVEKVSVQRYHMLCLNRDGSIQAIGTNHFGILKVQGLTGVRDVYADPYESVFLMEDGSVRFLSSNYPKEKFGMAGAFERIAVGDSGFGGIRADGTVELHFFDHVSTEEKAFLREMEASLGVVTDLAIGSVTVAGVRPDGTVLFTGNEMNVSLFDSVWTTWRDVKQVSLSSSCMAALHTDGTVSVAVNTNLRDEPSPNLFSTLDLDAAEAFTDVRQICASTFYIAALLDDGTVRITNYPDIDTSGLTDIVSLAPSEYFLAALTKDGRVLMRGDFFFWALYGAEGEYVRSD